jgi:glycosyltransferase involved in cell wall biosynthesis
VKSIVEEGFSEFFDHLFPSQMWLSLASLLFRKNVSVIKTEHAVFNNRMKFSFLKYFDRIIYSRYKKVICISKDVKDSISRWANIKEKQIEIIENGVNIKQIKEENSVDKITLEDNCFNIMMVARFDGWQKDQLSLIRAISKMDKTVHLFLAGVGDFKLNCEDEVRTLSLQNRVHFLGLRKDVYSLMKKMDLNVLISKFEGFSGVVLESLASGKLFLGSNVSGIKEAVPSPDFLISSNDPDTIAMEIEKLRGNKKLQIKLLEQAEKHIVKYDYIHSIEKIEKLYQNVSNI